MTTRPDNPDADDRTAPVGICPTCHAVVAMQARFCPACGTPQTHDTVVAPAPTTKPRRRFTTAILVAVGLGLALAIAGAVTWAMADSAADQQAQVAGKALAVAFDDLASAQTTADIRRVASTVEPAAAQVEDFVETLPADDREVELIELTAALTALATLEDTSGESPDAWDDAEAAIRDLADPEVHDATLAAAAVTAADHVDALMEKATEAHEEWQAAHSSAVAERDAAIGAATTYQAQVSGYLDQYADLRQQLSQYIDVVDTQGSTVDEGYRQLAAASQARRSLRTQMTSLTPPVSAAAAHDRLLAIFDDGIAGVEAAERGLDERECTYFGCNVSDQPSWQQFRSESKRISVELADAISAWTAAAQAAIDEAKAIELPEKPQL